MKLLKNSGLLTLAAVLALFAFCGCSAQQRKDRHLAKAERFYAAQELEKAKIEYLIVQRFDPTNAAVLTRLGRIYLSQGSVLQAFGWLVRAQRITPDDPEVHCAFSEIMLSEGQQISARNDLLAVLAKRPAHAGTLLLLPATVETVTEAANLEARLQQVASQNTNSAAFMVARGNLLLKQGRGSLAEACLQQALKLEPNRAEAHAEMAHCLMARSNFTGAEAEFKQASLFAPWHSSIRLRYSAFKASQGDKDAAKAILRDIVSHAPDYLPAQEALAQFAFQEGNYLNALTLTDQVIRQDPLKLEVYKLRSQLHTALGQPQKAVAEWEQLKARLKNHSGTRAVISLELARAYLNNRQPGKAVGSLDEMSTVVPNRTDGRAIEASLLKANILLGQKRGDEVVDMMGSLLQHTNVFQARLFLADGYRQAGRSADALKVMRQLVRESPNDPHLSYTLGVLLREQNQPGEARQAFLRSRELQSPNLPALNQIVELDIAAKNFAAALRLISGEQVKTNSAPLKYLEGSIYKAQKQWKEAEAAFMSALAIDPWFSNPYYSLAAIYVEKQQLEHALSDLEALLDKQPRDARALMLCGTLYSESGKLDKSKEAYERLLAINPQFPAALNDLAYLLAEKLGKPAEGLKLAKKAYALSPKEPGLADTLGWIFYRLDDYHQALPFLREAVETVPNNAEIQFHFGMTTYMLGQKREAQTALERALGSKTSFRWKPEAQRRLAILKGESLGKNATDDLEALLKSQPKDVSTRMRLAELYQDSGQPDKAARQYQEVLDLEAGDPTAALRLSHLYSGPLHDFERASQAAQRAYEIDRENPEANWLLGRALYHKADYKRAYALLFEANRRLPNQPEILYDYAWGAYVTGRLAEAERAMRQILAVKSDYPKTPAVRRFLDLSSLYARPKDLVGAQEIISSTLKAEPNHLPALMAQASLALQLGNVRAAAQAYGNILEKFPGFSLATRELAIILSAQPTSQLTALKLARTVRDEFPQDMELARVAGLLSFDQKDYTYALPLLDQVAAYNPRDSEVLFRLGLSHLQVGDKARAKQALERALALNLPDDQRRVAREELAKLRDLGHQSR